MLVRLLIKLGLYRRVEQATRGWRWRKKEEKLRPIYAEFVKPEGLVFDVGANVGLYTRLFRKLGARVVAVEPQSSCAARLAKLARRDPGVTYVKAAVGEAAGEATMHLGTHDMLASMAADWVEKGRYASGFRDEKTEVVAVTTLDALIAEYGVPDFVKIDVEGFEPAVLAGLGEAGDRAGEELRLGSVSFEMTGEFMQNTWACMDKLKTLGGSAYEYRFLEGEGAGWLSEKWMPDEVFRAWLVQRLERNPGMVGDVVGRME